MTPEEIQRTMDFILQSHADSVVRMGLIQFEEQILVDGMLGVMWHILEVLGLSELQ